MKYVFLALFCCLLAASFGTWLTEPDTRAKVPVLYWVTDQNPARLEQVSLFHQWLEKNHLPKVELRLDMVNNRKITIQSVAGISGDIIDTAVPVACTIGYAADVTEYAKNPQHPFDLSKTYPSLEPVLFDHGRQYGFPCNVSVLLYWINNEAFQKAGMALPPREWDFDTFEKMGKEFVKRANVPGKRQTAFFSNSITDWFGDILLDTWTRSVGVGLFNETMTRCTLDDERYAQVMERIYRWTYVDHILPSASDEASLAGGIDFEGRTSPTAMTMRWKNGQYAMISTGRWGLIRLREMTNQPRISVSNLPMGSFPNAIIGGRTAVVYAASKHPDLASLFLAFLASDDYSMHIVNDSDAMPPDPALTHIEAYRRPKGHENEWGSHEVESEIAETISIAPSYSPYVAMDYVGIVRRQQFERVMADQCTPREAARETAKLINAAFERRLRESSELRKKFNEACLVQKRIDAARKAGQEVPLEWISDPFQKAYYIHMGWSKLRGKTPALAARNTASWAPGGVK